MKGKKFQRLRQKKRLIRAWSSEQCELRGFEGSLAGLIFAVLHSLNLQFCFWSRCEISLCAKGRVYQVMVLSILLYTCKMWPVRVADEMTPSTAFHPRSAEIALTSRCGQCKSLLPDWTNFYPHCRAHCLTRVGKFLVNTLKHISSCVVLRASHLWKWFRI